MDIFKKLLKPLNLKTWSHIREGMLVRIFYILTTITGTLFLIWFVFFFLQGKSVLCFFEEIEENKAQLQILILPLRFASFSSSLGFSGQKTSIPSCT